MRVSPIVTTALLLCVTVSLQAQSRSTKQVKVVKVTNMSRQSGSAVLEKGTEVRKLKDTDAKFTKPQISGSLATARVSSAHVPTPAGSAFASAAGDLFSGFNVLSHRDQRLSDNGNQFSLEPPDQGLAVGHGFVVEAVNDAVQVFNTAGAPLTQPAALNTFFGLSSQIVRGTPTVFGPEPTDPKVYFDSATQRFFLTSLVFGVNSSTGALLNASVYIAVTKTYDPTGDWAILVLDVTNDGGAFAACPCFGDQPLIGADANGFYVSTNAFSLSTFSFSGANIYAMSKAALESASSGAITAVRFHDLTEAGMPFAFTIQPATVPPGGTFETNTEYFVSALDFTNTVDNRLVIWALKGTNNLATATLVNSVVNTQSYGAPPDAQQEDGPFPLGQALRDKLELVASNDDRLQQVVFADGKLWTALNTSAKTLNGPVRTAAAWFILSPSANGAGVSATVVKQGYIAINNTTQESVLFPSVAVNSSGKGVVAFSVVGESFHPSAAYAPIDANGVGAIRISGAGALPDDGFTGYPQFGASIRTGRWGDYSAAVADEDGNIWMANEYIPNAPRTVNANWGTFLGKFTPQ